VDVGANIGYMTSVLASRAGPQGSVHAFEPHPLVHRDLKRNAFLWSEVVRSSIAPVTVHELALSDRRGPARLDEPTFFGSNRGTAHVGTECGDASAQRRYSVALDTLDDWLPSDKRIGVLKVDVEGHEMSVFRGAARALREARIRDIVFESHERYPNEVTSFLEEHGYAIYSVVQRVFGPTLMPAAEPVRRLTWEAPNLLATRDSERATRLMRSLGWRVLGR
jgi:FkbM family methyltransferase